MVRQLCLFGCGTGASVVKAENTDAAISKLPGDPHHVVAAVTAGQTMHQNNKRTAWSPARRTVIVQNKNIAIGKFDNVSSR